MENTIGNKSLFLTQYQFRHLCFDGISNSLWYLVPNVIKGVMVHLGDKGHTPVLDSPPLKLKSVSSITDDDLIEILGHSHIKNISITEWGTINVSNSDFGIYPCGKLNIHQIDILRSKGYALLWMDLSVEKQIEYGWVKLG